MLVSLITTAVTQSIHTGVPTSTQLTSLITELCKKWPVVHDELNPTLSVPSIIVDLTWLLDQDESIDGEKRSRLAELIQLLIQNNCIPIYLLKERLEPELLESLNIIPHAKKFAKTIIRMNTTLLYKQTKFNLLREETEGYSKLCVELVENLPQPLDVYWSKDKSSGHQIHIENRKNHIDLKSSLVLRNISSLIGFFDLDPNRVLDVILDIFAANVMDHWEFFIVLLSKSPWQPKESSTGQKVPREIVGQILGFKFSYYTREESTTPVQLFWVAALLVKHGIVRLEDLYPHLHPEDEQIPKDYQTYTMGLSKKARGAGRYITPKLSGMLGESLPTINTVESDSPLKKPEPRAPPPKQSDQKSGLVQALIALGDLNYSMKIIDMHPQLAPMNTDIGLNICRLLNVMLEAVDSPLRPLAKLNRKPTPSVDEFSPAVSTLNLRLCKLHDSYVTTGRKYYPAQFRFFYELWKDEVPVAESFLKALGYLKKYLPYVGHHLYGDVLLLGKIIRIGKHHVTQSQHEETIKNNWMAIIARFIFPAVAQLPANPGLGFELWKLIKLWPYTARYGLYGEWRHFTYKNIPELEVASTGCKQDMSWILKRLSKDNIKLYGRHIGKIVHSNPTIAFSEMLPSLQKYNNLIPLIVDDTRYLTDLELDILSFCLIESFARTGNDHDRIEENGTTFEAWLKALALFCGTLFKKHGIDMQGIFQYIANQLLSNNVYDLLVLQELITHMTGIDVPADAGIGQLAGLSGGTWIRRVVFVYESARNLRKPTARLVKALLSSKLTMQLGILIAKHRKEIVFRHRHDEEDPSRVPDLKVLAWLNDHCQQSFLQYFEFLTDNIGSENYLSLCPSFKALVNDYELDVGLAFHILRPKISYLIQKSSIGNSFVAKKATTDSPAGTPGPSTPKQSDEMEIDHVDGGSLVWSSEYTLPVLQEIITTVKDSNILKKLSVEFYATFWQLALPDIHVPIQRYESELQKLKDTLSTLEKKKDRSKSDASNRRRERDRALSTQQHLTQELNAQKENQRQTLERLKAERHGWFQSTMFSPDSMEEVVEILQFCIYPRCAISAADAIYCAKFVSLLHSIGTPNLSIVTLYDQVHLEP
ncbi:transcription factor/nuclear export subunit protein 2-domain-containing protein [Globomyces pollinis-pini]|nr:transcription factor/nuclear export subunit protein 2-domain-containing protein [Globomyces pollinis-pini]